VSLWKAAFTMEGDGISGNTVKGDQWGGGGLFIDNAAYNSSGAFTMKGGRIQGSKDSDGFTRNTSKNGKSHAIFLEMGTAKWGTGGAYSKGGVPQPSGSNIGSTNDTLIAIPAR
jgi:hypothetical protein